MDNKVRKTKTKQELLTIQFERFKKNVINIKETAFAFAVNKANRETTREVRKNVRSKMNSSKNFPNSIRGQVYDKPGRLADSLIYSNISYSKIFETGGTIQAKGSYLFVPIMPGGKKPYKSGYDTAKDFKESVFNLIKSKKAFVKKHKGDSYIVYVKVNKQSIQSKTILKPFLSTFRAQKGLKRIKDGYAVPVAIFKKQVKIGKKLDFEQVASESYLSKLPIYFKDRMAVLTRL